jgi:sugar phosphate isomerase/epimerase
MNPSPFLNTSVSRRKFLQAAGVAAVAGYGLTTLGEDRALAERRIVVGAHPWVYAATQPNYDITPVLPQIFADMRYAGLDGIELMHTALRPANAVQRIGQLAQEHELAVIGTSFGGAMWDRQQHQAVLDDAELIIPRLAELGGRTLGISVGAVKWGDKTPKTRQQLDAQAELLTKIFAVCRRHEVVPNLHNHTYEVENDLHDLKGTLARLPETRLGPDLNWLLRGGVDPVDFLKEYGSQIVFLHLRDQSQDGRWSEALGAGDMDYSAIADALREIRFQGDAVIELAHERDFKLTRPLRESLKISRQFVLQTLGF